MGKMNSARWSLCLAIAFLGMLVCRNAEAAKQYFTINNPPVITGQYVPELASLDRLMVDFMLRNDVPGTSVAISRHGVIIYARVWLGGYRGASSRCSRSRCSVSAASPSHSPRRRC